MPQDEVTMSFYAKAERGIGYRGIDAYKLPLRRRSNQVAWLAWFSCWHFVQIITMSDFLTTTVSNWNALFYSNDQSFESVAFCTHCRSSFAEDGSRGKFLAFPGIQDTYDITMENGRPLTTNSYYIFAFTFSKPNDSTKSGN